jgi:hypothetical protein
MFFAVACGPRFEDDDQDVGPKVEEITLLENARVIDEMSLGAFKEGDVLKLTVTGIKYMPTFTDIFVRTYHSSWQETICFPGPRLALPLLRECYTTTKGGACNYRIREQREDEINGLEFNEQISELPLKIKITDKIIPIGEPIIVLKDKIFTKLKITNEILSGGEELKLQVSPQSSVGGVQVGFLGFAGCAGEGKRGFSTNGPLSSSTLQVVPRYEFEISAQVERIAGDQ